jgi:hypothetical protein
MRELDQDFAIIDAERDAHSQTFQTVCGVHIQPAQFNLAGAEGEDCDASITNAALSSALAAMLLRLQTHGGPGK